jgi:hypothetical protein
MQLLDHFEEEPSPIGRKDYFKYSFFILVIIESCFILKSLDIVEPFPLFEMPAGWLMMFCLWLTTFRLYQKAIQSSAGAFITSILGFVIGGAAAIFVLSEILGLGRSDHLPAALTLWLCYTLGSLLCFKIIQFSEQRQT